MSVHLGFHNVARVSISEDREFNTDLQFSARTVTLEFTDGSEYLFHIYGDRAGIPVRVQERETLRAAA
jgi:hypothetical protein